MSLEDSIREIRAVSEADLRERADYELERQARNRAHQLMGWRLGHKFVLTDPLTDRFRVYELIYKEVTE